MWGVLRVFKKVQGVYWLKRWGTSGLLASIKTLQSLKKSLICVETAITNVQLWKKLRAYCKKKKLSLFPDFTIHKYDLE